MGKERADLILAKQDLGGRGMLGRRRVESQGARVKKEQHGKFIVEEKKPQDST